MIDDKLIWKAYDEECRRQDQKMQEPGQERWMLNSFKRSTTIFTLAHLSTRVITLNSKIQLPTGSMIHLLDDVSYPESHQDTPRCEECDFLRRESLRKFIYHNRTLDLSSCVKLDETKFIYRQAGMPANLMKWRMQNMSKFKPVSSFDMMPKINNVLCVISHNPLFRVYTLGGGKLRYFRRIQIILTSILNNVHACIQQQPDKQQFIFVPWDEDVIPRSAFMRTLTKVDQTTIRQPNSFHYIFMMELLNYVWEGNAPSLFKQLPKSDLSKINLILHLNDRYVIFNLATLKGLNTKNNAFIRIVNLLNLLSVMGRLPAPVVHPSEDVAEITEDNIPSELKGELEQDAQDTDNRVEAKVASTDHSTSVQAKSHGSVHVDASTPSEIEREDVLIDGPSIKDNKVTSFKISPKAVAHVSGITEDDKVEQVINKVASKVKVKTLPKAIAPKPSTERAALITSQVVKTGSSTDDRTPATKAIENQTKIETIAQTDTTTAEYHADLDAKTDELIESQDLTVKQKARLKMLARKYREIKLDDEFLDDIIEEDTQVEIPDTKLGSNVFSSNPKIKPIDESIANSTIKSFDRTYMKTTYKKQLGSILTSFRSEGVFLTDLKTKRIVTPVNDDIEYSAKYVDIQGRQSTIKFKLPNVDRNGRVKIDGIDQILLKQRINLPIVKLSDINVSISSCYNKALIKRVTTRAHDFFSYIDKVVNTAKSTAKVIYGHTVIDAPISYEYASLAAHYAAIEFKAQESWSLCFDYNNRLEHFGDSEEKLQTLEDTYGIYVGHNAHEWLFIDNQNTVRGVLFSGGEDINYEYPTIKSICFLSLKEGVNKPASLTEYTVLDHLGTALPVIFVLGYRYGLRKILDYLKIKYVITERKSKVILSGSESLNNGTESYTLNTKNIYHSSDTQDLKVLEPRHEKTPDGKDIGRVFGSPYLTYSILFGDSWDDRRANLSAYSDSADGSNPRFVYTFLKDISYKEVSHPWSTYVLDPNAGWKQYAKSTTEVICYKKVKVLKEIKHNNWIRDILQYAADPKNHLEIRGLEHVKGLPSDILEGDVESFEENLYDEIVVGGNRDIGDIAPHYHKFKFEKAGLEDANTFGTAVTTLPEGSYKVTPDVASLSVSFVEALSRVFERNLPKLEYIQILFNPEDITSWQERIMKLSSGAKVSLGILRSKTYPTGSYPVLDHSKSILEQMELLHTSLKQQGIYFSYELEPVENGYDVILKDLFKVRAGEEGYVIPGLEDIALDTKYVPRPDDIGIRFKDKTLWFNRYPLKHSLIVAGLDSFNTEDYDFADFNSPEVYTAVMNDMGKSPNYLKGLDSFYDLFIDPITFNVLKQMHEPTTVRDIFIRASELLTTRDYRPAASSANYRIRGYEQFNYIVYNEMAQQIAAWQASRGRSNNFTINPEAIYLRVVQNASMEPTASANPLQDIKLSASMTFAGAGGRTSESFVVEDRKFTEDSVGIMAMDTTDNQKVGMNAQLTLNSSIATTEGLCVEKDRKDMKPSDVFSIHTLLFPFGDKDDAKRLNCIE